MHVLERERLDVPHRRLALASILPRRDMRELIVLTQGFVVGGLAFFAEVSAARLAALQRIERQELRELEVIGDAAGVNSRFRFRLFGSPGTETFCQNSSRSCGMRSSAWRRPVSWRDMPT
jgi:hypothetical protein